MDTDYDNTEGCVGYNQTLPSRRATLPTLLARNSAGNLNFYRAPISPGARSVTSRSRFNLRKSSPPKRRVVKRRLSMSIFTSFAKSLKTKKSKAAVIGRAFGKLASMGHGIEAGQGGSRTILDAQQDLNATHESDFLDDDFAQYLTVPRRNNPFKTPPQTPVDDRTNGTPSPPLTALSNTPESLQNAQRERRSQMKSLQILGPEAHDAIVGKRKGNTV